MKWGTKLEQWGRGVVVKYPKSTSHPFFWETPPVTRALDTAYEERFIPPGALARIEGDHSPFEEHFSGTRNRHVAAFPNLSRTAMLIVPIPRERLSYTTLKHFIDHASLTQQRALWKKVASCVRALLKHHDRVWVSTHGLSVPYLHVRVDLLPKYQRTEAFR